MLADKGKHQSPSVKGLGRSGKVGQQGITSLKASEPSDRPELALAGPPNKRGGNNEV